MRALTRDEIKDVESRLRAAKNAMPAVMRDCCSPERFQIRTAWMLLSGCSWLVPSVCTLIAQLILCGYTWHLTTKLETCESMRDSRSQAATLNLPFDDNL